MTEHCQGAEQQQGWLWSVLMLPPVPPYANVPPVPMSGIAIAVGVGAAWVVAVEGAKEIVLPLCLTRRGPLLPASAHPFSFPALGDHACCGTVHICLGTHKEGTWGKPPSHQPSPFFILQKSLPTGWRSLQEGLVHRVLQDPVAVPHRPALLHMLSQALGLTSAAVAPAISDSPQAFVGEMEVSTSWGNLGCSARAGTSALSLQLLVL